MPINRQEIQQFSHLELIARQVVEGFITGLHKSPFHGFSVEFAEHRLYNSGESTKHIDWKLYGRTDKMFVKRYEEETNLRCHLVIDHSSSMYFPLPEKGKKEPLNKITFSVQCAAAIAELLRMQRDAVGLSVFGEEVEVHTPARSSNVHHKLLFNELEKLLSIPSENKKTKTFAVEALHQIAESIHNRSLVIIFSDMFDSRTESEELFSALQHLRHNRHEVILFHVTDKQHELDFEYENRPYTFVDMESGEEVKVQPNEIKDSYIKTITEFKQNLKLRCGQYRIDFVEADINEGFKQVLLPYLLKRTRML
ncbi:MAG: DUF58 domain-containing protein [Bacteroidetes bacterium]|nr:DUF58 domain-containing protein [Bacteroidota bacterium]PHX82612.1 MAG: DUF58 domain-containing protein [Flavobacteriales bacterium]